MWPLGFWIQLLLPAHAEDCSSVSLPLNKETFIILHSEVVWTYFIIIYNIYSIYFRQKRDYKPSFLNSLGLDGEETLTLSQLATNPFICPSKNIHWELWTVPVRDTTESY